MERVTLVNRVIAKLDEIMPDNAILIGVGAEDNSPVSTIIEKLLDESALEVLLKAPIHRLSITSVNKTTGTSSFPGANYGYITVPTDFVRLVSLRMKEWKRPVVELQEPESYLAKRQANRFLMASITKPIAVLNYSKEGHIIEYYSVKTNHDIEHCLYIKTEVAENIPTILLGALEWICASKVLTVLGQGNESKLALENAVSLMQ